jgi:hypothetical protein
LTFGPNANFCGLTSFTYTLAGGSTATVSVSVTCAPKADTTPPGTTITKHPRARVVTSRSRAKVTYVFRSSEAGSRFACKLDGSAFGSCTSPKVYKLKPGRHVLRVRATDRAGNTDPTPAKFVVKVIRRR